MFKTNEYYEGKVKSISYEGIEGKSTIGVMAQGEYEFNTSSIEYMTVTSGEMRVLLPNKNSWKVFYPAETFIVEKGKSFKVKVDTDTSYKCVYK